MTDTTDIEALVAELRRFSESTLVNNAANALERQQADLEEARADYCAVVGKFDDCRAALAHTYEALTGKIPRAEFGYSGPWHEWLISAVEKTLERQEAVVEAAWETTAWCLSRAGDNDGTKCRACLENLRDVLENQATSRATATMDD